VRRSRIVISLLVLTLLLLVFAPDAFARANGGQGWFGESTDKDVTDVMFAVIAFFPTVILVFSLIQWRLEKRKHDRMDAIKRRAANVDWRGGW
jgi:hypothetical protein